jgi:prepilin-type N-terminal cleavage/methylation domain-containing protein
MTVMTENNILRIRSNGFTLIELSIVIVIIGLVIGGVLVGKDLIASSKIRAQISQVENYTSAFYAFKTKYGYAPGDMPPTEAAQLGFFAFTGAQAGKGCKGNNTAYGNNDGIINGVNEALPFWSHLSDSKLIGGNFGGTAGNLLLATSATCVALSGRPPAGLPTTRAGWELYLPKTVLFPIGMIAVLGTYPVAPTTTIVYFSNTKKLNIFLLEDELGSNVSTSREAYLIDSKLDDGLPATGNVRDFDTSNGTATPVEDAPCTTTGVTPIGYNLSPASADAVNCRTIAILF